MLPCPLQLGDRLKTRDELRAEWEAFQTKQKKVGGLHRLKSCRSLDGVRGNERPAHLLCLAVACWGANIGVVSRPPASTLT